jgi:hypothetical protein
VTKCIEKVYKHEVHRKSFRRVNVREGYLLFACPKRHWRGEHCLGGMKLYEKVKIVVRGGCPGSYKKA